MSMLLNKYYEDVLTKEPLGIRILRVADISEKRNRYYNIIIVPTDVDADVAIYKAISDIEGLTEKMDLYPNLFTVYGSWLVDNLIKGCRYVEDLQREYFESEV